MTETFTCFLCKRELPIGKSGGTGYARLPHNATECYCYDCCAWRDAHSMKLGEPITLYLTELDSANGFNAQIGNWPGTLKFGGWGIRSRHNMAGPRGRRDVWFTGPDGAKWHGVNIGDNQILRCHRLKRQRKNLTPLKEEDYLKPYPYGHK